MNDDGWIANHSFDDAPWFSSKELKAHIDAEQQRILKIVYEQSLAYGKTGECMWIGIKSLVRKNPL